MQWTKDNPVTESPSRATVTDKADPTYTISGTAGTYNYQVRSYKTVSGRTLNSEWATGSVVGRNGRTIDSSRPLET